MKCLSANCWVLVTLMVLGYVHVSSGIFFNQRIIRGKFLLKKHGNVHFLMYAGVV